MTQESKQNLKSSIPTWLTVANFVILLTLAYNVGSTQTEIEKNVESNTVHINKHESDLGLHMPFEKKIEVFVPRVELDSRLKNMESMLKRIESKIN